MQGFDSLRAWLADGDRGVSEVIGSILVFGLVVALLAIMQVQAVPNANQEHEFNHNERVQGDLSNLQATLSRTAAQGEGGSVKLELGTTYPQRMMFYNPPPVQGQLQTTDPGPVVLDNVVATNSETAQYLDGSTIGGVGTLDSRSLIYRGNYNEYDNAPVTISENTLLLNRYQNGNAIVEDQGQLVSGRKIKLTTVAGDVEESSAGTVSVRTKTVSSPSQTVPVQAPSSGSSRIQIAVPTVISEEVWIRQLLSSQIDDGGDAGPGLESADDECSDLTGNPVTGNDRFIVDCGYTENPNSPNVLALVFQREDSTGTRITYEMDMARIGIGNDFSSTDEHYITPVPTPDASVETGETVTLVAQVRDRFNNPVSGVSVSASTSTGTATVVGSGESDEEGKVYIRYSASVAGTHNVDVSFGSDPREIATFNVEVGEDDQNPPTVDTFTVTTDNTGTCDSFSTGTGAADCLTTRSIEQYLVELEVSDNTGTEAGIDYLEIEVLDSSGNVITKEVVDGGEKTTLDMKWVSPWLTPSRDDPSEIRVTVVDEAGKNVVSTTSI